MTAAQAIRETIEAARALRAREDALRAAVASGDGPGLYEAGNAPPADHLSAGMAAAADATPISAGQSMEVRLACRSRVRKRRLRLPPIQAEGRSVKRYAITSRVMGPPLVADDGGEWVRHADAEAEVEKWKRVAVWAARRGEEIAVEDSYLDAPLPQDDASILAALATAEGEE